jgi:transposase
MQIPGIDRSIASSILAEIGVDMTVFGTAKRLAAWAGVCPGNHESAGRQKRTAIRKGNVHLKTSLVNEAFLDQHAKRRVTAGLLRRLNTLGYDPSSTVNFAK